MAPDRALATDGSALLDRPIADMGDALASGRADPLALTEAALDRIDRLDGAIGAFAHIDAHGAREAARSLAQRPAVGALHGIPIAVKDCIDTADMPTTYGSAIFENHRPRADAACVALLREAGAIIVGKTALTEFAAPTPGKTRNPVDPDHTPGGSSSGSAAAVAAGMVPAAIGSQTMGSLLRPAAYCGAVAYKPSFGVIPTFGMKAQVPDFDHIGVIARTLEDAHAVAAVLGAPPQDAIPTVDAPRLALSRGPAPETAEPAAVAILDGAAEAFAAAGAAIAPIPMPVPFARACEAQIVVLCHEMARSLAWEWFNHRSALSPLLRSFLERGWETDRAAFVAARTAIEEARRAVDDAFGEADAILTYSAPGEAPRGLENTGDTIFNRLWTALRLPAITLPAGTGANGLPIGISLVGRFDDDAKLLAVASWCERRLARPMPYETTTAIRSFG